MLDSLKQQFNSQTFVYNKGKVRKFTYTTEPSPTNDEQTKNLILLYKGDNTGDKTIWTDKTQFN